MNILKNECTNKPCYTNCAIIIIGAIIIILIILILFVLLFFNTLVKIKNNLSRRYAKSIIKYCKDLPDVNYTSIVRKPDDLTIYHYPLAKALLETSLLVSQSNCLNIVPIRNPISFSSQYRITGINPYDNKKRMFSTIFGSIDGKKVIIAFTGTILKDEWFNDFNFRQVAPTTLNNYEEGILVHQGFYNVYSAVRDEIWKTIQDNYPNVKELYITGHSLGGALSTLAAFDFANYSPIHYSFASPRVGNVQFAEKFNNMLPNSFRIYNIDDIVPEVPPPVILGLVYQHVNNGIAFDVNLGSTGANHVEAYLEYLPECIENIAPCKTSSFPSARKNL